MSILRGIGKWGAFRSLAAAAILAACWSSPAKAGAITFAQYSDNDNQDWQLTTNAAPACTGGAGTCVTTLTVTSTGDNATFILLPSSGLGHQFIDADFTFTATSSTIGNCQTNCNSGDGYTQGGYSGSFTYTGSPTSAYAGIVLLSGTFTNAVFSQAINSNTGSIGYSGTIAINPGNLSMTSQILNFNAPPQVEEDATWTFSSVTPAFSIGPNSGAPSFAAYPTAGPFDSTGAGTFATSPGFAPEPGSVFLIGIGLCGIGVVGRRIRSRAI